MGFLFMFCLYTGCTYSSKDIYDLTVDHETFNIITQCSFLIKHVVNTSHGINTFQ